MARVGVKVVGALGFSESWDEGVVRGQQVVGAALKVQVVGVHEHAIDVDVQSLLFWEPYLGSDAVSTIVVEHVDAEVLRWNTREHDLILQALDLPSLDPFSPNEAC